MAGILALIGKATKGDSEKGSPMGGMMGGSEEGPERAYAREAFSALKDDDEEGFVSAFISAVRACAKKSSNEGYEDEEV